MHCFSLNKISKIRFTFTPTPFINTLSSSGYGSWGSCFWINILSHILMCFLWYFVVYDVIFPFCCCVNICKAALVTFKAIIIHTAKRPTGRVKFTITFFNYLIPKIINTRHKTIIHCKQTEDYFRFAEGNKEFISPQF